MKVKDISGNISSWIPKGDIVVAQDRRGRSQLHINARGILYEIFPNLKIIEEVSIKTRPFTTQFLDFYIPNLKLAIEVHGSQHYKFNSLYHATAHDFIKQRKKDADKREWCEINGITYIELPYNKEKEWKTIIRNRHNNND